MENSDNVKMLRIFIGSTDKFKHTSLYEVIVFAAKRYGLAGATVLKGIMGYGANSKIYCEKLWEISENTTVVIEIIDIESKIKNFYNIILPYFEKTHSGCIITIENVQVLLYKNSQNNK